jgi:hypothetical protein
VGQSLDETRDCIIIGGKIRRFDAYPRLFDGCSNYRIVHRGSVVRYDLIGSDTGIAPSLLREYTRRLRKQLDGSHFSSSRAEDSASKSWTGERL